MVTVMLRNATVNFLVDDKPFSQKPHFIDDFAVIYLLFLAARDKEIRTSRITHMN